MKAFVVEVPDYGVIVFHETANKARVFAMYRDEAFEGWEYVDVCAKREPRADHLAKTDPYILNFCDNVQFYKSLGNWQCMCPEYCGKECVMKEDGELYG